MKSEPVVVFEDNHLLIVNKPCGWLVQGDKTGDVTLTDWGKNYIKGKYQKPGEVFLHPAHRIDRPVSGLVLFARTTKALQRMNQLFRDDQIEKTYLAMVKGRPEIPADTLIHWLVKNESTNISTAHLREGAHAKRAELRYETLQIMKEHALLKVMPKTGRPHQIRVQLAKINYPILGDVKYGYPNLLPDIDIALHAYQLHFVHPVKKAAIVVTCTPKSSTWKPYQTLINELDREIKN